MKLKRPSKNNTITVYQSIKHRLTVSVEYSRTQLSDEVTHRIAARTVSGRDHETMTHVPRDTHVTKQRMAMRSNFPWSDFKKLGTPELSSSSSTSTALSLKNFEKRAHPTYKQYAEKYCKVPKQLPCLKNFKKTIQKKNDYGHGPQFVGQLLSRNQVSQKNRVTPHPHSPLTCSNSGPSPL